MAPTTRDIPDIPTDELVSREKGEETPKVEPAPKRVSSKRPTKRESDLAAIREQLLGTFTLMGGGIAFALPVTGRAMILQSEEVTDSLIAWGKTSPKVAKALLAASKTSGAFGVLTATAPILLAALTEVGVVKRDIAAAILPKELIELLPKPISEEQLQEMWNADHDHAEKPDPDIR